MKLYFSPGACSLAVHIALREAGLPFDLAKVDLATHKLADGSDFFAVNPRGYVPVLETAPGERRTEVTALLLKVASLAPAKALLPPAGSPQHDQALQWLVFVATELHKTFSPWLWHKETAASTRDAAKQKLAARFTDMDAHLAQAPWLAGEAFSVADIYGFTIVNWSNFLGISLKPYPVLSAWMDRVRARPAVQDALGAEGLLS
ncbi:glutathione transferase GstA [Caenimonas sedimenti]|uniref:Glutathione transferase GstA n=1 Tax=Caenimonas sedimenti TaxID=2596921 RepID=A0A562ZR52_9BURK|nr:glutathione binding-like protein [Caenimonas sedimenti]TWO70788.1 glutathione transferase GstA [Caenimonas sedimenti]